MEILLKYENGEVEMKASTISHTDVPFTQKLFKLFGLICLSYDCLVTNAGMSGSYAESQHSTWCS